MPYWLNQPSQWTLSWAHILDIPPGIMPVCVISLLPLHWLDNSVCLSWAFFPFTHSLCRVARQISIIHKQLSYLPQQTTRVFVYRFKINNLHSWLCSEHLSGLTAFHLELEPGVLLFGKIADVYKWALEKLGKYWDLYFELSWEFQKKRWSVLAFIVELQNAPATTRLILKVNGVNSV